MFNLLFRFWPRSNAGAPVMTPAVAKARRTNSRRVIGSDYVFFMVFFIVCSCETAF